MAMRLFRQPALVAALLLVGASTDIAQAESVPFACEMQPDHQTIRIVLSNPARRERSCIASCQFQTPHYGGEVQVICAHPVAADATDIEMCTRDSGGQELIKQTFGSADCYSY
jgi:hypothetical protein